MDTSTTMALSVPGITEKSGTILQFITHERINRRLLWIALPGITLQFIIFKLLYPFPDFFSDSYSYIYAAYAHLEVSIWPIGYSKFLAVFHKLTHSDTALVGFQYFFLEATALYFYFTLLYFFRPGKPTRTILYLFLFFNPLFLYLSNYVNSDPLFAALSLWWFTELLWIINRPRLYQVFTQGLLLFLAFTVRNNAYIYPLISIATFLFSRQSTRTKLAGSLLGPALILPFILHTRSVAKEMTGTAQFSLFTGWQLANNALYMYGHIQVDSSAFPTKESRQVNDIARDFYKTVPSTFDQYLFDYPANYFIQYQGAPLKVYLSTSYHPRSQNDIVANWGNASVHFGEFGSTLIKAHPIEYIRYFALLNTRKYLFPSLEKLEVYNTGSLEVESIAQFWFGYESTDVAVISRTFQGNLLSPYPYFFMFLNIFFVCILAGFFIKRRFKNVAQEHGKSMFLLISFTALNFLFCISTTIIVLRYQFFPMVAILSGSLLLLEWSSRPVTSTSKSKGEAYRLAGTL
jgi:hypothetical protein